MTVRLRAGRSKLSPNKSRFGTIFEAALRGADMRGEGDREIKNQNSKSKTTKQISKRLGGATVEMRMGEQGRGGRLETEARIQKTEDGRQESKALNLRREWRRQKGVSKGLTLDRDRLVPVSIHLIRRVAISLPTLLRGREIACLAG